jgi:S1-C subfamily serine protease
VLAKRRLGNPLARPESVHFHLPRSRVAESLLFSVTRISTFQGERVLTAGSGFFFERGGRLFLVTSRHVFIDAASGHLPDRIAIVLHTDATNLTRWSVVALPLYLNGRAAWKQAADSGGEIDVAVLEVPRTALPAAAVLAPFGEHSISRDFSDLQVGAPLLIACFPLGFYDTVHHLPVVRQATVASALGVRFQGQGYFLTDARMHRGASGAPVVLRRAGGGAGDAADLRLLGVHSSGMDMKTRDREHDDRLGLNCAWYADILLTLTA